MRTLQLYVREHCGTRYADKAKARECEAGHKAPEKIVRVRYRPPSMIQSISATRYIIPEKRDSPDTAPE